MLTVFWNSELNWNALVRVEMVVRHTFIEINGTLKGTLLGGGSNRDLYKEENVFSLNPH